ncbi:hypothetical protein D8674_026433 [Pyrus ussuriensis x Pyrus communis]|uniref:Uncharacterized protein n=1 Tax=Pyrus ussuriensis x Pyrus communis TaxID=2448454 RepID=A0A5N5I833_9ROSA|nr:hypothetical protein D8674_026433 [Pyrus ussuriensis x Pyrus communis]
MDSTTTVAKLTKRNSDSNDFAEIDHACSARYENLIQQGINRFLIILESLQSKD